MVAQGSLSSLAALRFLYRQKTLEFPQSLPRSLRSGQALSLSKGPKRGCCDRFAQHMPALLSRPGQQDRLRAGAAVIADRDGSLAQPSRRRRELQIDAAR